MVLNKKEKYAESFGRWIEPNEIVIEDLSESDLLKVADRMSKVGYHLEYWKAPKQESGHLHIKNIQFPEEPRLQEFPLQQYKERVIKKYVPEELWNKVDLQVTHKHRIVKENTDHYKGYGTKELVKEWNRGKVNYPEKKIFFEVVDIDSRLMDSIGLEEYDSLIKKIIPYWTEGRRQDLAISLAGYLRKEKRVGLDTAKQIIAKICKLTGDKESSMRNKGVEETFRKDEAKIKGFTGLKDLQFLFEEKKEERKEPRKVDPSEIRTFNDFKKLKKNKNYLIDGFLYPGSVNMVYSPPAMFKSLLMQYAGMCISTGKTWLGMKTKKFPVLYCDGENSDLIIKDRLIGMHKGLGLRRGDFPFYVLTQGMIMDEKKNIHVGFTAFLEQIVEEKGIKVIFFDTMHRFAFYDENSSDDINKLYTRVFKPLVEKYKIAIVFLHHSRKDGGYRGSGDFLGMVDVSYKIYRDGKSNKFRIINEKNRNGEITDLAGEIDFQEEYMQFIRLNEDEESENKVNKLKEVTMLIKDLYTVGAEFTKKDIISTFEIKEYDFGSEKNVQRALKFLVENGYFDKGEKRGAYRKIR